MKIYTIQNLDLEGVTCSVPTEENYCNLIIKNVDKYSGIDKTLLAVNWVRVIKKYGVKTTQLIIDNIRKQLGEEFAKCFTISQHINCNMLNWYECVVFSCHATIYDDHVSIPHWPINAENKNINQADKRDIFASFMGSYETHVIRRKIEANSGVTAIDTGKWHFENRDLSKEKKYKDLLSNSVFSICPRGTGHGTIRLWESLSSGCIPVIISDGYKVPSTLPKDSYVIIEERNCTNILEHLVKDEDWIKLAQEKIFEFYNQFLTPVNFHESVIFHLN